ncbi:MAG: ATP-binding protein [Anaerolineae bacterium]|jgi:anti-sigma regulatory factor (Ser/Thr protein kinase)
MDRQEICYASDLGKLGEISEFVGARARQAGLSEDGVYEIQMATDEACTNSIEHAYEGRTSGQIDVCCYIDGAYFVVRVTDYGRRFDPDLVPMPDVTAPLEERTIGGLGLFFMRRLVDSIEFSFDPIQGNQVVMRKRRSGE